MVNRLVAEASYTRLLPATDAITKRSGNEGARSEPGQTVQDDASTEVPRDEFVGRPKAAETTVGELRLYGPDMARPATAAAVGRVIDLRG